MSFKRSKESSGGKISLGKRIRQNILSPLSSKKSKLHVGISNNDQNEIKNDKTDFSMPSNKALCQSFYESRKISNKNNPKNDNFMKTDDLYTYSKNSKFTENRKNVSSNNNNNVLPFDPSVSFIKSLSTVFESKPNVLTTILQKIEEDSSNKKLNGRSSAFCSDIIEVQLGYCINVEAYSENIIKSNYWRQKCDNNERLDFAKHRVEGVFYINYLQEKFKYEIETFQLACFVFDKFYQNSLNGVDSKIDLRSISKTGSKTGSGSNKIAETKTIKQKYLTLTGILQVASVSIFLAAKYEQIYPKSVSLHLQSFKSLPIHSDYRHIETIAKNLKSIDKKSFFKLERTICRNLQFNFSRPTPITYLRFYSFLMELDGKNHKFSQFLVDLLLISNKTCHLTPSVCAVVATMMSRKYKNKGDFVWTKYDKALTGYSCEDVKSAIRDLARSLLDIGGSHAKYDASEVCAGLVWYGTFEILYRIRQKINYHKRMKFAKKLYRMLFFTEKPSF